MSTHNKLQAVGAASVAAILATGTLSMGTLPAMAEDQQATTPSSETQAGTNFTATVPTISGQQAITLTKNGDVYSATVNNAAENLPAKISVTAPDGTIFDLNRQNETESGDKILGVTRQKTSVYAGVYTADGGHKTFTLTAVAPASGTPITANINNSDVQLKADTSNVYQATGAIPLGIDNAKPLSEITLSNGQKLPVTWDAVKSTINGYETNNTMAGVAQGTVNGQTARITLTADNTITWTATVGDAIIPLTPNADGSFTATAKTTSDPSIISSGLTATKSDGTDSSEVKLAYSPADSKLSTVSDQLGVIHTTGDLVFTAAKTASQPSIRVTVPIDVTQGTDITLADGSQFTKTGTNQFTAQSSNYTLNDHNQPNSSEVELSDGQKLTVTWDKDVQIITKTIDGADVKFVRLNGTATGSTTVKSDGIPDVNVKQDYTVNVTADRAVNTALTNLTVTQTNSKGETADITFPKFSADQHEYSITLPHSAVGDSYTLSATAGVDATVGKPHMSLKGTSRVLTINVNGIDYTVTVNFQAADIVADSPAKLDGIYVNYESDTKGTLIDGWNPNRLDYTIALKDANQSPYILPVAPEGVTIKAGDVTQSAQSTKQEWVVTDDASGASRTYSVTVTRPVHTAVTEFEAKTPVVQDATVMPDSPADTNLASVGYVSKDGKYVPADKDEFTVPDGGTFSYEPKTGQSTTVTTTRNGMTYTYTVNVLASDGTTFAQHTYKVTYITPTTHKAQLDGIVVDGTSVNGFNPDTLEYTVKVNDPSQWTIVAQYDKDSGMSVSIEKNGADATITVTSGDGLTKRVYKVHAEKKLFAGKGTVGVNELANTGTSIGIVVTIIAVLAAIGIAISGAVTRLKHRQSSATDITDETKQSNISDESAEPDDGNDK